MSDTVNEAEELEAETVAPNELSLLKSRAQMMKIPFSNNIGVEALRQKIAAKMAEAEDPLDKEIDEDVPNPLTVLTTSVPEATVTASEVEEEVAPTPPPEPKKKTYRQQLIDDSMKLIRLRITNLDPKKKDLPGEIITVANEYIGNVRKYVPFGEVTDNGYHVPNVIFQMMKERQFLSIRVVKTTNGRTRVEQNMAKEFALEVLDPLTPDEIRRLAASQAAAAGIDD